jgi:hypothetical protein
MNIDIIAGELAEQKFLQQWQEKVNLMILVFFNLLNFQIARWNRFNLHRIPR